MMRDTVGQPSALQVRCWFCGAAVAAPCVVAGTTRAIGGAYPFHRDRVEAVRMLTRAGKMLGRPALRLIAGGAP